MIGRHCRSAQYGVMEPKGYPGRSSEIVDSTPKLSCKNNRLAAVFSFILSSIGNGHGENYLEEVSDKRRSTPPAADARHPYDRSSSSVLRSSPLSILFSAVLMASARSRLDFCSQI